MAVLDRTRTHSVTRTAVRKGAGKGATGLGIALAAVATVVWSGSFVAVQAPPQIPLLKRRRG
ncbi:hypothetical protein [Streptomyces sp. NPDC001530]|uniref:hypothetical protein n=1 Tax=Streptomyces sp. NPDC001530 TaxID=3364582 RepID=UPI0036A6E090